MWGIHRSLVNSPHKGPWRVVLMFSLICVWINGWVNNREAGDLIRYRAHYDVIVMIIWDHILLDILVVPIRFRFIICIYCDIYCLQPSNSHTYLGQDMVAELLMIYVNSHSGRRYKKMTFLTPHMLSYTKCDRFYGKCNLNLWNNWKCHMNKCELVWNQT